MKLITLHTKTYLFLCCAVLSFAACVPADQTANSAATQTQLSKTITPPIPTVYRSAPQDDALDAACRITINFFFGYKQGASIDAYRDLFIPSSKYLAESIKPPAEALILLELMPASQWWQEKFPATPIPNTILPQAPDEYFYRAKYTGHYDPNTTPAYWYPDSITFTMVADGPDSCKIKGYGKG